MSHIKWLLVLDTASMGESSDLLFFDTFSHESSEELNLDLVQFPKPVYVAEVRIIPLGARVQGDFPGGVRLGATNPTQFHIDFFVNDLSKPGASTFETLGSLDYCQNGRIHMDCEVSGDQPRKIPTDGLVLRGWYSTITLAVYGSITKSIADPVGAVGETGVVREVVPPPRITTPPAPSWPELGPPAEVYPPPSYPQEDYDQSVYPSEYYNRDVPKDPRAYHHSGEGDAHWDRREDKDRREISRDRDNARPRDKERARRSPSGRDAGRARSRSIERMRSRESPRYSRSRSRDRDYPSTRTGARDDSYRRDDSRSPGYRDREKDWDHLSYKRDEYRRHRPSSYDRSRAGSYEKRGSSFEKRAPSYERRAPSYEKRAPSYEKRGSSYEKRLSPYEKRASSFEKRDSSYEKRYDKRAPSYERLKDLGYDRRSRSPCREDPRKRPRTPPIDLPRRPHTPEELNASLDEVRLSPGSSNSVVSDECVMEYSHNGKPVKAKDIPPHKGYKSHKGDSEKLHPAAHKQPNNYIDSQHPNIQTIKVIDGQSSPAQKIGTPLDSPCPVQDDNVSVEQFEPILSDEDICDDLDGPFGDLEYDMSDYCGVDDILKCYNPFRAEWHKYIANNKSPVYIAPDVENKKHVMNSTVRELCSLNTDFQKLVEIMEDYKKAEDKFLPDKFPQLSTDAKEEWVHVCEQLPLLINNITNESDILLRIFKEVDSKDMSPVTFQSVLNFTLNFCRVGLDYELALSQTQATYKIRHIKCGIRLIEALCAQKYSGDVVVMLLKNNVDVFARLFELYSKNYMALSIKLMILKALDSCLASEQAIEHFLCQHFYQQVDSSIADDKIKIRLEISQQSQLKNGYQILIIMLNKNPLSRVKFAINSLINKLNIYELMKKLRETILNLSKMSENYSESTQEISEAEIELIINSLEEILSIYRNGSFELSQPRRFLPVSAQFEINKSSMNSVLLDFFQVHKLLETCLFLLTCPLTYNYPVITNPIYEIISNLANCHEGLIYLLDNIKTSEMLFKCLLQPYTQQSEEDQAIILQDVGSSSTLQQLGLEMAHKLQAMYYINAIFDIQSANHENEPDIVEKLHGLYCLGFGCIGKLALASVLSMGDNIQCLLNVFEKDIHVKQSDKDDSKPSKQKSPAKNYAVDLTVSTVQFSSDVNFLKKYGRRILNIAKKYDIYEQSIASNLQEVLPYLKPLEKSNIFSFDNINDLVDVMKASIEHATSAPGDLITCLRILRYLGIPEYEHKRMLLNEIPRLEYLELKYKYIILQLFSLDGISHIVSILEKLCSYFEQPSLHTATFVSVHGLHIANVVLPCLELLNKMLTYVIQCRNTKFKDLTAIPVILQTFNLMHSYATTAVGYKMAQKACMEAVDTLLSYTQPIAEDASENELIHKSLWTLLCSEIIKYIQIAPYTFIPGLLIFSEMLPLPLPIQTKFTLNEGELSNMVSNRKLWSGHLHTLSTNITEMIQIICLSACQPVIQLLRRVCIQLSDLASNTSLCVTRAVLDLLITQVFGDNSTATQPTEPANYNVARLLNFLACLVTHASIKCTLIHMIRQTFTVPKSEDRYWLIMPILCGILTTTSELQSHIQSQECVVSIFNSLCDSEITLLTQIDTNPIVKSEIHEDTCESGKLTMTSEVYLANALPLKETITSIINATFDYITSENSLINLIASIMRMYFLLTEHDYGFYYFRLCLEKNKQVFVQLFAKIVSGLGKESPECVTTFLELLRILQNSPEELEGTEGMQFSPRTSFLTIHEVADIIGWNKNDNHPITDLEIFLKNHNEEELLSHVRQLLTSLRGVSAPPSVLEVPLPPAPILPPPEPLATQFGGRLLWAQGDAQDERLGSAYWLGMSLNQIEDDTAEAEMIPCDLGEVSRLYLPAGTDLAAEAERLLHLPPVPPRPPQDSQPLFRTKRLHVPRDKRPYVSPARGRGGVSQTTTQSTGVSAVGATPRPPMDAFRSRPPNTSRPPSLHVDDFLALEGCGAQPTGPTGYNKLPVLPARGRGMRSRGVAMPDRGRFASATPSNTSMYNNRRGRGSWGMGGVGGVASEESSSHFGRNASQHFQPPMMQHNTNQYSGNGGWGRGGRGGRGLRHTRPSFMR